MNKKNKIFSPCDGEVIRLEDVTDEVFSSGIMGEGFGVLPTSGKIYAPISGKIENIHRAAHAYSISCEDFDVLVHIGIDTVELEGECFEPLAKIGETVEAGDELARADINKILEKGFDPVVVVVVSSEKKITPTDLKIGECRAGNEAMHFTVKNN